eukprot:TRINITY_DN46338_c0_g1_i2.p1 TRINITY_DN46338_c0_g1~~TRINITY_DN46338_c0_g1_i2.p1  ORF type:complete len:453 (+),score=35.14 TRINITY_DN46338_c0_g1_i2:95-1360(+)
MLNRRRAAYSERVSFDRDRRTQTQAAQERVAECTLEKVKDLKAQLIASHIGREQKIEKIKKEVIAAEYKRWMEHQEGIPAGCLFAPHRVQPNNTIAVPPSTPSPKVDEPTLPWGVENDKGSFTLIKDETINQLLTDMLNQMKQPGHCKTSGVVTYFVGNVEYKANLKQMVQINQQTGTERALREPNQVIVPTTSRKRQICDLVAKPALNLEVIEMIVEADMSPDVVVASLKEYATERKLDMEVVHQLEHDCAHNFNLAIAKAYTDETWLYKHVNDALRAERTVRLRALAPYVRALCHTLKVEGSDFSAYTTTGSCPNTLKRRMKLSNDQLRQYKEGKLFTWTSFTSTSTVEPDPQQFGNALFEIDYTDVVHNCSLFMEPFSRSPGEFEVLLPPGCKFKVQSLVGGVHPVVKLKLLSTESYS